VRLDARSSEHPQFGDGAECNRNKNGQHPRGLKRQISHLPTPYTSAWMEYIPPILDINTLLYGAAS
jgi:hypothetical protein